MTCLMVGAMAVMLSGPGFSLHWTHSVEKIEWVELWQVEPNALRLVQAKVKGSGAGMEPGEGAIMEDGWWTWRPDLVVPSLRLAASGATKGGWRLCDGSTCHSIGATAQDPFDLRPCTP